MSATSTLAGRRVHRMGYGAMQLERSSRPEAVALLRAAVELGVDHIDTADFYGEATVNHHLREALGADQGSVLLATKIGARRTPAGLVAAQRPDELRTAVTDNLRSLGVDRLDLVYLRRLDLPPGILATGDQVVPLEDQLAVLTALRDDGLVGAIGLSGVSLEQAVTAAPAGIAAVQNLFNLLERDDEPLVRWCAREGIAYVPFFPLGSGFPGRARVTDAPALVATASRLSATRAQVALAWLLARDPGILLIPGTTSPVHLHENLAAVDVVLDPQAREDLGLD